MFGWYIRRGYKSTPIVTITPPEPRRSPDTGISARRSVFQTTHRRYPAAVNLERPQNLPDGNAAFPPRLVTVRATNYDGSDHWVHPATLLHHDDALVITKTSAGLDIAAEGGIFTSPYDTNAYYWPDRWFNVIRLELPGKGLFGYYCNIASPLRFDADTVGYIDLQLDVIARVDEHEGPAGALAHLLADEDEFEVARERYNYPAELIERCYTAVEALTKLIEARTFPFDVRP